MTSEAIAPKAVMRGRIAKLPLRFEANAGQWDERVRFRTRGSGATLYLTDDGTTIALGSGSKTAAVTMRVSGATRRCPRGEKELVTKSHFFLGNDPSKWRTNVPNYETVRTKDVLPGVDVVWHGGEGNLEYDLEVAPDVDATTIALEIHGADGIEIAKDGSLEIATAAGMLVQQPPRVVQSGRELPARWVRANKGRVRFALDGYDVAQAVLIDPMLEYSTYLGGSAMEWGMGIAVDASGNAYVVGETGSNNFPTKTPFQSAPGGGYDAFVAKFNAQGSALVYSTFLGGSAEEDVRTIAVDGNGNAYIAGTTLSSNFPTQNPIQSNFGGGTYDVFVGKLNAAGSALVYSTYLGGSSDDTCGRIAIDGNGNAYVAGATKSYNFPTQGAFQSSLNGTDDAFVTKLNAAGSALVYSTYLGGSVRDFGGAIAVDGSGNAYVSGSTNSTNFPTQSPFQSVSAGGYDAFVTKFNAAGSALVYSTYLGGSTDDGSGSIAVDASGNVYLAGDTYSVNFPLKSPFQSTYGGGMHDVFVTKLDAQGSALVYSTYLGGTINDQSAGIAVGANGDAYVIGSTGSTNFPTKNPFQSMLGGNLTYDVFVARFSAAGALVYSTYLGGSSDDEGYAVAVDGNGSAFVTGFTGSQNFPKLVAFQPALNGSTDAFLTKLVDSQLSLGTPCKMDGDCASLHCTDGVCCDSACTDQCAACDVIGKLGTCTPVTGGPHPSRMPCAGTNTCAGSCDGMNTLACAYPGSSTVCDSTCSAGAETDKVCDGKGSCVAGPTRTCSAGCADSLKCKPNCVTNADCASGFTCTGGACIPSGKCDCAPPNMCNASGQCVPPANSGGCACSAGENGGPTGWTALAVICVIVRSRQRRKEARCDS